MKLHDIKINFSVDADKNFPIIRDRVCIKKIKDSRFKIQDSKWFI